MKTDKFSHFVPYPDHYKLTTHLCLKILDIFLAIIASFVNLIVFVAVVSSASLREKPSIIFILSLTVADLWIALIDMPLTVLIIDEIIQGFTC